MPDKQTTDSFDNIPADKPAISKVIEKLDAVILAAEEENMGTSELIGLLFYYAHNLAQEARDAAIKNEREMQLAEAVN